MSINEIPRLRCLFCVEPLVLQGDDYIHDYITIRDKLLQLPTDHQTEAVVLLFERCQRAGRTIDIPPTSVLPRGGAVYSPSLDRWIRPETLEKVNFFGGIAGTYDGTAVAHQMNAINSAMLIYFAEKIEETGRPWNELR